MRRPLTLAGAIAALTACGAGAGPGTGAETVQPAVVIRLPSETGTAHVSMFLGGKTTTVHVGGSAFASTANSGSTQSCECFCGLACLESPIDPGCFVCTGTSAAGPAVNVANHTLGLEIQATTRGSS